MNWKHTIQIAKNGITKITSHENSGVDRIKFTTYDNLVQNIFVPNNVVSPTMGCWLVKYAEGAQGRQYLTCMAMPNGFVNLHYRTAADSQVTEYYYMFPYLYSLIKINKHGVFEDAFMYTSFTAPSDTVKLFIPRMPNVYSDTGRICWGDLQSSVRSSLESKDIFINLEIVINSFLNSYANNDYVRMDSISQYNKVSYPTLNSWQNSGLLQPAEHKTIPQLFESYYV